jgi:hypothetical protein
MRGSILYLSALFLLGASTLSCGSAPKVEDAGAHSPNDRFTVMGTMKFINVEGGCWYLETESGERYELGGEDLQQLYVENLTVEVQVRLLTGVASICQVGTPVEVLTFHKIQK